MPQLSFDIQKTKAILVGVGNYTSLPKIAPALNNITVIRNILTDKNIIGLPAENILPITDKRHDEISYEIYKFLNNSDNLEVETLIFYYAGHGIREVGNKEFYLTGVNTQKDVPQVSAIPFNYLKQQIENASYIQNRIVLIDACHSGLATMGDDLYTTEEMDIKGSYTITSAANDEKAFFDPTSETTFFTGELADVLKKGLPISNPFLSLETLYSHLKTHTKYSTPQRKSNLNTNDFFLSRNPQFDVLKMLEREADVLFDNGDYVRAKEKYADVFIEKQTPELKAKIEKCREYAAIAQRFKEQEQRKREKEQEAETLFNSGDYESAIAKYADIFVENPTPGLQIKIERCKEFILAQRVIERQKVKAVTQKQKTQVDEKKRQQEELKRLKNLEKENERKKQQQERQRLKVIQEEERKKQQLEQWQISEAIKREEERRKQELEQQRLEAVKREEERRQQQLAEQQRLAAIHKEEERKKLYRSPAQ